MELEVYLKAFADMGDQVSDMHGKLMKPRPKPVRKPVGASMITSGTGPQLILVDEFPSSVKVWQVIRVAVFGSDGHTAVGTNPTPAQPAVPASTVAVQNTNLYPVQVVITAGTITAVVVNGITVGTAAGTYTVPANGAISITYSVAPTWVWSVQPGVTVNPAIADVYGGYGPDPNLPDMQAQILSGVAVPSITQLGPDRAWVHHNESLYGVVNNAPNNQQLVLVALVDEYNVEDMEAMSI